MPIAIIDLGTNTFNLLIVKITNQRAERIFSTKIAVRLGEGGISKKHISEAAEHRAIQALRQYKNTCDTYNVKNIFAFATSAIREATNGKELVKKIAANTNIVVNIINGDKEAELIYHGVKKAVELTDAPSLIMDIGGGSTEFIIANKTTILWKQSFLLGVARLLEVIKPSDPIQQQEIENTITHFENTLSSLFQKIELLQPIELVGSSGSFDTFAEMITQKNGAQFDVEKQTSYLFKLEDFKATHQFLLKSTQQERLQTPGLVPMRADMIVLGSIFVNYILEKTNLKKMRLSTFSLKEGVLDRIINNDL
ncbi:MAG: exopolyphosphatase [Bacteroidetes bacterium]|nr:exopolyphosphatase [Bacteroidota bacterium]